MALHNLPLGKIAIAALAFFLLTFVVLRHERKADILQCSVDTIVDSPSPDQSKIASIKHENCSGPWPYTIVFLTDHASNVSAEVFKARAATRDANGYSLLGINISWKSESELVISYPHGTIFGLRPESFLGVHITYTEQVR